MSADTAATYGQATAAALAALAEDHSSAREIGEQLLLAYIRDVGDERVADAYNALRAAVQWPTRNNYQWSPETPTEDGWYWARGTNPRDVGSRKVVRLVRVQDGAVTEYSSRWPFKLLESIMYAGPIAGL